MTNQITINNLKTKIIQSKEFRIDLSFKMEVTNNSSEVFSSFFKLQGIDKDGFAIAADEFFVKLEPQQTKSITDITFIDKQLFDQIDSWHAIE